MLPRILAILALACCAGAFSPLISVPLSRISHAGKPPNPAPPPRLVLNLKHTSRMVEI
jgi:hypothetical protein